MYYTPYESSYYCEVCRKYGINPNAGTLDEIKEELKSLAALDWFSFVRKASHGISEFCVSDSLKTWLKNDPTFRVALTFINCFFLRESNDPFPERDRCRRKLPRLQQYRIRKKQAKRIHQDIEKELRKLDGVARRYRRHEDVQKIREVKLALWAIYQMVLVYYVESAPRISEELYKQLSASVPAAQDVYSRRADGQYVAREHLPIRRLLGQAGANVILISRLERFSKYMGYFRKK